MKIPLDTYRRNNVMSGTRAISFIIFGKTAKLIYFPYPPPCPPLLPEAMVPLIDRYNEQ